MTAAAWRATLSATAAILVGIGLARFAYTPLIPAVVAAGWFDAPQAAYLGAANLGGYLVGALLAIPATARIPARVALRWLMVVTALSFFASAVPLSFVWFFDWRFVAGVTGAGCMVLAAPTALQAVPSDRRGLAGGIVFIGVGAGIAASGTLVPLLLRAGLAATWCGLGALAVLLTAAAWGGWPDEAPPPPAPPPARGAMPLALGALFVAYAANAAGLVPHMIFLVDFVARGLGRGIAVGAAYWVLVGFAAMAGSVVAGRVADRFGFARCLRVAFLLEAAAVALPALSTATPALVVSSIVIGGFIPGITALLLGRIRELTPGNPARQRAAWSLSTMAWALGQAGGAFFFSWLFARAESYAPLFFAGSAALVFAFAIDVVFQARR